MPRLETGEGREDFLSIPIPIPITITPSHTHGDTEKTELDKNPEQKIQVQNQVIQLRNHQKLEQYQMQVDRHLPEAQTCFFTLSIPNYSTTKILREKLRQAITSCKAIDTDFRVRDQYPTSTTAPLVTDPERRRRRQLLRSRTHNSSEQSQQDSRAMLSEDTLSFLDHTFSI
jgi:hypothetical protein